MINTRASSRITERMVTEYTPGRVETFTKAITRTTCGVDTGRCTGKTGVSTEGNGSLISKMEMGRGSMEHNPFKEDFL